MEHPDQGAPWRNSRYHQYHQYHQPQNQQAGPPPTPFGIQDALRRGSRATVTTAFATMASEITKEELLMFRRPGRSRGVGRYQDFRPMMMRRTERAGSLNTSLDGQEALINGDRSANRKTRKMSLSCLANSILSLEKGRRRAVGDSESKLRDQELLQAAETGDVATLRRLIFPQDRELLHVNCTDMLGRTPLNLAVANEHQEAVQLLLDHVDAKSAYEALLLAIKLGHDEIAEMILEHPKYDEINVEMRKDSDFSERLNDHSQFTDDITPLILAAQNNRYEVVMALLMKGQLIEKPHKYNCICSECCERQKKDELKFAKGRLNAYKGMASEAYISLSSEDPILTSFQLRNELHEVATAEKYYTADYNELSCRLSEYVVKLLDKVQGNEELNVILHNQGGVDKTLNTRTLARLQLAIGYKEKKFVAHPSCQKKLTTMWYANCEWLKNRTWGVRMGIIILIAFAYPFLAILYMVAPKTKVATFVRTPCIKFVAETTSFFIFLAMIVSNSFAERQRLCDTTLRDNEEISSYWKSFGENITQRFANVGIGTECIRTHHTAPIQMCIGTWIFALLWQELKQLYQEGAVGHFSSVYNHMDFFMLNFYIASFTLRFVTYLKTYYATQHFLKRESWISLINEDPQSEYLVYWLVPDRFYWDTLDPTSVCEALYSVANVLTFARLFYLLAINEHLGPMLISLERMIKDVMKFMVTFLLIFLAFMVGLHNLYWYYEPSIRGTVEMTDHAIKTRAEQNFGTLEYTFRTVFWALFGLSEFRAVEIGQGFQSRFTESVGYIVFAVYNWAAVIILLNMLIAMMTRSFEKITREQDVEWKFARSQLYMEYIKQGSTLPVPFNIIPTPKSIAGVIKAMYSFLSYFFCRRKYCDDPDDDDGTEMNGILGKKMGKHYNAECEGRSNYSEEDTVFVPLREVNVDRDPPSEGEFSGGYKNTVKKVVRRYIFERLQANAISNEGDIDVIRQSVGSLQEDVRQKQKDLDMLLMQQSQIIDGVNSLRDGLASVQRSHNHFTELLGQQSEGDAHSNNHLSSANRDFGNSGGCGGLGGANAGGHLAESSSGPVTTSSSSGIATQPGATSPPGYASATAPDGAYGGGSGSVSPPSLVVGCGVSAATAAAAAAALAEGALRKRSSVMTPPSYLGPVREATQELEDES